MAHPRRSRGGRARPFVAATMATLLAVAAAACGDGEASGDGPADSGVDPTPLTPSTSATPATPSTSAASESTFPVAVETKFGEVTIEERPERVVALGWGDAETALALGVQPVGASDWLGFGGDGVGPWAKGLYDESPALVGTLEPSFEKIAALRPDVILDVKSSGERQRYELLSKIAPTVAVPEGADQYLVGWRKQLTMIGAALGKSDEAQRLLDDIDAEFAAAADRHPEFEGKTITVGAYSGGGYGAYVEGAGRVTFMEQLGFVPNPKIGKPADGSFSVEISSEQLGRLDADLVVMTPIGVDASVITEDPVFQAVPAVQDGRVVVFDDKTLSSAFSMNSVLSIPYAIETVVPRVAKALEGS